MPSHDLNHLRPDPITSHPTASARRRPALTRVGLGLAVLAVSVCGACANGSPPQAPAAQVTSLTSSADRAVLSVRDAWVKSAPGGMTAVFGVLANPGSAPVTVVSARTSASDRAELHTTVVVDGVPQMRSQPAGFTVAARGEHVLQPGGDHVMVMGLRRPVLPGDEVTVWLHLSDGRSLQFTALAKQTSAGAEHYEPSGTATRSEGR